MSNVVSLGDHQRFRPDPAGLARQQLASARESSGLSEEEFTDRLNELLDWTLRPEMIRSWEDSATPPGDVLVAAGMIAQQAPPLEGNLSGNDLVSSAVQDRYSDVTAVYPNRSQFAAEMSTHGLLDDATSVQAAGLSLNLICQQYPSQDLARLVESGAEISLLFLDPAGQAIRDREREERFPVGHLASLTALNLETVARIRKGLSEDAKGRLDIRVYDETIRLNMLFIDARLGIVQPYLPEARGVDSPTLVVEASRRSGLFPSLRTIFDQLWTRGTVYEPAT